MKVLISRCFMILISFALIGYIWGKLKPVGVEIVYLDLQPTYRSQILQIIEKKNLNPQLDLGINIQNENNFDDTDKGIKSESDSVNVPINNKKEARLSPEINLESVPQNNEPIFDKQKDRGDSPLAPLDKKIEMTKPQRKETFLQQIKRFFHSFFSNNKQKDKEDIEQKVLEQPIAQPIEKKADIKTDQSVLKPLPTVKPKVVQKPKQDKALEDTVRSSNFLLDDILPNDKKS